MEDNRHNLYHTDDNGLSYFYATTADRAEEYAADIYKDDLRNADKIRKVYRDWIEKPLPFLYI